MKLPESFDETVAFLKKFDALQEGHFLLASGRHSAHYVQKARLVEQPRVVADLLDACADGLAELGRIDVVFSPAMGGVPVGQQVGLVLGCRHIYAERDAENEMVLKRGFRVNPGERVLLVEDVITTGGTLVELRDFVEGEGGKSRVSSCWSTDPASPTGRDCHWSGRWKLSFPRMRPTRFPRIWRPSKSCDRGRRRFRKSLIRSASASLPPTAGAELFQQQNFHWRNPNPGYVDGFPASQTRRTEAVMNHLLALEDLSAETICALVERGAELKAGRVTGSNPTPLAGQIWALIFSKSSTRTRVSFEAGIRELGGQVMFLSGRELQLGRGEPIRDTARVMGRMVQGAVIRTFDQQDLVDFAEFGRIPTINALTDAEHPCQILADLLTMKELCGGWEGKKVAFLGDGDCNVPRSWIWASERLGFELAIGAPEQFLPRADIMDKLANNTVTTTTDPREAVAGANVVYTDVWVSMGKEEESADRIERMRPYQINDGLLKEAAPGAHVMHCLPAYRDKEITESVLEAHAATIFQEAENRLHAQKAVLDWLSRGAQE